MKLPPASIVLEAPHLWPAAVAAALLAVLVVAWLYAPQVRLISAPWRWTMPALRCAALVFLAISIIKPVSVRPASSSESGAILIAIDNSMSMSARDLAYFPDAIADDKSAAHASALVSLADGLGLLPAGTRNPAMGQLLARINQLRNLVGGLSLARSELEFARVSSQGLPAAQNRVDQQTRQFRSAARTLLDQVKTMQMSGRAITARNALQALAGGGEINPSPLYLNFTVIAPLARWVQTAQFAADLSLYQSSAEARAACDRVAGMSRFDRAAMALTAPGVGFLDHLPPDAPLFGFTVGDRVRPLPLRGQGQSVRRLLAEPDGMRTDLLGGLHEAIARLGSQPLQAVVLISDGRITSGDTAVSPTVTAAGAPIYCVYVARQPELPIRDVAITSAALPPTCFMGETATLSVTVRGSDIDALDTVISASIDNQPPATRPIFVSDQPVISEFPMQFPAAGIHRIQASIPAIAGAPTLANKHVVRWVKVLSQKLDVGLFCRSAGGDYQEVSAALKQSPWVTLHRGVIASASDPLPLTPAQIRNLNLLMLFDVPHEAIAPRQWEAIDELVRDRGGSVLLVAGPADSVQQYAGDPKSAALLPWQGAAAPIWRDWPGRDAGFHMIPAPDARDAAALALGEDGASETSDSAWQRLPAFSRYLALPPLKPAAQTLLMERDSSSPLLVENRLGQGRCFFLAMDETWRFNGGEKNPDRFWLGMVRYAAGEPYAAQAGNVWLDADPIVPTPRDVVRIRARIVPPSNARPAAAAPAVELWQHDQRVARVPLSRVTPADATQLEGSLTDLKAGDYELRLRGDDGAVATLPLHVQASDEAEMANLSGSQLPMRRLAEASGGAFVNLEQINSVADLIAQNAAHQTHLARDPLWDSYPLYAFVVGCLAAEWAIRKRLGLM